MAGSTRTAADPHDAAYKLGLAGKPLSAGLKREAETDDSILDSWREGKADRPDDQPDSDESSTNEDTPPPSKATDTPAAPAPKARRQPTPRSAPSRSRRGPTGPGSRSRTGRPTLGDPTGGRLPISFDGNGLAGVFFGAIFYALVISVADYGASGPGYWFKAKFLNQPAPAKKKP